MMSPLARGYINESWRIFTCKKREIKQCLGEVGLYFMFAILPLIFVLTLVSDIRRAVLNRQAPFGIYIAWWP